MPGSGRSRPTALGREATFCVKRGRASQSGPSAVGRGVEKPPEADIPSLRQANRPICQTQRVIGGVLKSVPRGIDGRLTAAMRHASVSRPLYE